MSLSALFDFALDTWETRTWLYIYILLLLLWLYSSPDTFVRIP